MSDIQVTKDAITLWFEATDAGIEFSYRGTSIYYSHGNLELDVDYTHLRTPDALTFSDAEGIKKKFEARINEHYRGLTELTRQRRIMEEVVSVAGKILYGHPNAEQLQNCIDALVSINKSVNMVNPPNRNP